MKLVSKFLGAAALAALLVAAPAFSQDISTDYDHNFHFNTLKKYSWGKVETSDPLLEPRLAAAVDHVLQGYGFKESAKSGATAVQDSKPSGMIVTAVEANSPSQYVAFYRRMHDLDWRRTWGGGGFADSTQNVRQLHGGTLVIDIYDGGSGKLIWRGIAAEGANGDEKAKQDAIDKEVASMFQGFPPNTGGSMPPNQLEVPPSPSSQPTTAPN